MISYSWVYQFYLFHHQLFPIWSVLLLVNGHVMNRLIGGSYHIFLAYFSDLNFREHPHKIWSYMDLGLVQ